MHILFLVLMASDTILPHQLLVRTCFGKRRIHILTPEHSLCAVCPIVFTLSVSEV